MPTRPVCADLPSPPPPPPPRLPPSSSPPRSSSTSSITTMKPCLKLSNSSTTVLCSHRKCVAFGAQVSEEVHIADEWDRTPTEPTRRLTYQDLLELKEIQRSLPHANQPLSMGGRHYLSQVPIALVPLLPEPEPAPPQCKYIPLHLPFTPPSSPYSGSSSRTSSPPPSLLTYTDPPTPSLTHTSLDSSPHSSPDPNPFLPLLSDDPDPHLPIRNTPKQKKKKFIIVNDIEIELDDSDSDDDDDDDVSDSHPDSDLDHLDLHQLDHSEPERSATPTPPSTQLNHLDLDPPNSALFSQVMSSTPHSRSCDHPDTDSRPQRPTTLSQSYFPTWCENPSPTTPKQSSSSPSINLHIPVMFKRSRSGSCLSPGTGPATPSRTFALAPAVRGV